MSRHKKRILVFLIIFLLSFVGLKYLSVDILEMSGVCSYDKEVRVQREGKSIATYQETKGLLKADCYDDISYAIFSPLVDIVTTLIIILFILLFTPKKIYDKWKYFGVIATFLLFFIVFLTPKEAPMGFMGSFDARLLIAQWLSILYVILNILVISGIALYLQRKKK